MKEITGTYNWNERERKTIPANQGLRFLKEGHALAVCCLLNSSLFYRWFIISSDCRVSAGSVTSLISDLTYPTTNVNLTI